MSTYIREKSDWKEEWKNFRFEEFACSCCGRVDINSELVDFLQKSREELGESITINSGYRCPDHNSKVSSTGPSGPHTKSAVDIHISNSQHRKRMISYFAPKVSGLGIAKTFIHIDLLGEADGFDMRPNCWLY